MSKQCVVIGGGHAGSSAAIAAARFRAELKKEDDLKITLINRTNCLGIRPRYYEYELEQTQVPYPNFLSDINVDIIIDEVKAVDFQQKKINTLQTTLNYDTVVLALGSELIHPDINGIQQTYNIDSYDAAKLFRQALISLVSEKQDISVAILGGGITGIELATELPVTLKKITADKVKLTTYLFDRNLIPENIGEYAAPYIQEALKKANICCISQCKINQINKNQIFYNDVEVLHADIIVSTLGLRANRLTQTFPFEKDNLGRIKVNTMLNIDDHPEIFIAGDLAVTKVDKQHDSVMSCQQGRPQGRYAGYNAVAYLYEKNLLIYTQPNYVTCIDLGDYGALYTEGWQRQVKLFGLDAKKLKQHINCDRIYPPQHDKDEILKSGIPNFQTPVQTIQDE